MAKKKSSELVAVKNDLVHRSARFTPLMSRCYVKVLWEFSKRYEEWEAYNPQTLFGDPDYSMMMIYQIPQSELDEDHLKDVKKALIKLSQEGMKVGDIDANDKDSGYKPFLSGYEYSAKNKTFTVYLSPIMVPYLIEQKKNFTQFNAIVAMQFSGKYTERFYELCNQYRRRKEKTFFLEVDEIKRMFRLENGYSRFNDFCKRVIDPAKEEMKSAFDNGSCDLWFDYYTKEDEKTASGASGRGRKANSRIWFTIAEKKPQSEKNRHVNNENLGTTQEKTTIILSSLGSIFGRTSPYYRCLCPLVTKAIIADVKVADKLIETLKRIREGEGNGDVNDAAAYTRSVLEREYGMVVPRLK